MEDEEDEEDGCQSTFQMPDRQVDRKEREMNWEKRESGMRVEEDEVLVKGVKSLEIAYREFIVSRLKNTAYFKYFDSSRLFSFYSAQVVMHQSSITRMEMCKE